MYICTGGEGWRQSSWNEPLYYWQIVGIKPEMLGFTRGCESLIINLGVHKN